MKGLEFACDIHPSVPTALVGDPGRLRQIITNLVGNAIKFTEGGEVALAVAVEARTAGDAMLRFSVSDTGIGVPPEQQEAIFKPFIQADGSTTRKYGGTGLGLAISTNLVGLMGGRIWLESEAEKGSRFYFTVPFDIQQGPVAEPTTVDAQTMNLRDTPVLVVDDNADQPLDPGGDAQALADETSHGRERTGRARGHAGTAGGGNAVSAGPARR